MTIKTLNLSIFLFCTISLQACQSSTNPEVSKTNTPKMLIVYYSHSGNTATVAQHFHELTGADTLRIEVSKPYPCDYQALVDQAETEVKSSHTPEIVHPTVDISSYDIIFIGSPSWWHTIAPPILSFIKAHSFGSQTIVPFITHEGSRMGNAAKDIRKLCPQAKVLDGLPIRGSEVNKTKDSVKRYLEQNGWLSK